MDPRQLSPPRPVHRGRSAGLAEAFSTIASLLRELVRGFLNPYRPERHYMRGPGPKWRELHGGSPTLRPVTT